MRQRTICGQHCGNVGTGREKGSAILNENIQALRKSKGLSQEELALKLNVVRQTVSKWESGRSVPDADILLKIADVLDVSISDLLGAALPNDETQQNEIAAQLIRLNEQYAIRNRRSKRIWRVVLGVLVGLLALIVVSAVVFRVNFDSPTAQTTSQVVQDVEE